MTREQIHDILEKQLELYSESYMNAQQDKLTLEDRGVFSHEIAYQAGKMYAFRIAQTMTQDIITRIMSY